MIKFIGVITIFLSIFILGSSFAIEKIYNYKRLYEVELKQENKNYYAIIEIPKINLKQEIFEIESKENDVNKNVFLHPSSKFPNHIVIAAHSGLGKTAFFKNLYKIDISDIVKIFYQNYIYEYLINEIEYQEKTGILYLKNNVNLTLITCTKGDDKKQTIYYGILKKVQKI